MHIHLIDMFYSLQYAELTLRPNQLYAAWKTMQAIALTLMQLVWAWASIVTSGHGLI